jgi:hypothetical protein
MNLKTAGMLSLAGIVGLGIAWFARNWQTSSYPPAKTITIDPNTSTFSLSPGNQPGWGVISQPTITIEPSTVAESSPVVVPPEVVKTAEAIAKEQPTPKISDLTAINPVLTPAVVEYRENVSQYQQDYAKAVVDYTATSYGQTPEQTAAQRQLGYDMITKSLNVGLSSPQPASAVTSLTPAQQAAREAVARQQQAQTEKVIAATTTNAEQARLAAQLAALFK